MKLYIYDHCPYCVKARMIFGLKDIPVSLETLLSDDVDTPTRLIGQKMVPILLRDDGVAMPESMDIVRYVDALDDMAVLVGATSNKLAEWVTQARDYMYPLAMPRWPRIGLAEFATESAVNYFTQKKQQNVGNFDTLLSESAKYIAMANAHLRQLDALLENEASANTDLSEDDMHVFATLRSLSCVKGLEYPDKLAAYRFSMSERSNIPLHDAVAI